jgi:YHS domain-containing protein
MATTDMLTTRLDARISFPRVLADSSLAYQGKTYHFVSARTRQAFEKDPTSYLGAPGGPPAW